MAEIPHDVGDFFLFDEVFLFVVEEGEAFVDFGFEVFLSFGFFGVWLVVVPQHASYTINQII